MSEEADEMIGVREAARIAGVHENTIRNWAKDGILESHQIQPADGRATTRRGYRKFSRLQIERLTTMGLPEPPPADRTEAYQRGYRKGWDACMQAVRSAIDAIDLIEEPPDA